ncbi:copper chaperone PCu(A)C [Paraglaciecola aestuariivivens]
MRLIAIFSLLLISSLTYAQIKVTDATIRLLPPGVPNSSAYFSIENSSSEEVVLVSAKANFVDKAEIHAHIHENNMMRMQKQEQVVIPAGKSLTFEPGGLHIMLFGLHQPLKEGQFLGLSLQTQSGDLIEFKAKVARLSGHSHH